MIKFNLNYNIYIQITDEGWEYLRKTVGEDYITHCIKSYETLIENEKWYKLQIHHVFNLFPVGMGRPILFKMTILIDEKEADV